MGELTALPQNPTPSPLSAVRASDFSFSGLVSQSRLARPPVTDWNDASDQKTRQDELNRSHFTAVGKLALREHTKAPRLFFSLIEAIDQWLREFLSVILTEVTQNNFVCIKTTFIACVKHCFNWSHNTATAGACMRYFTYLFFVCLFVSLEFLQQNE